MDFDFTGKISVKVNLLRKIFIADNSFKSCIKSGFSFSLKSSRDSIDVTSVELGLGFQLCVGIDNEVIEVFVATNVSRGVVESFRKRQRHSGRVVVLCSLMCLKAIDVLVLESTVVGEISSTRRWTTNRRILRVLENSNKIFLK